MPTNKKLGGRFSNVAPLAHPKKLRARRSDRGGTHSKRVDTRELWQGDADDAQLWNDTADLKNPFRFPEGYEWYDYEFYTDDEGGTHSARELWEAELEKAADQKSARKIASKKKARLREALKP